jgi:hypothetical protein
VRRHGIDPHGIGRDGGQRIWKFGSMRPEAKLILLCCSAYGDATCASEATNLILHSLDWSWLERFALSQGVMPSVARRVAVLGLPEFGASKVQELRIYLKANQLRNRRLAGELLKILGGFAQNDVEVLAFKGPILASLAYGDLSMRAFTDLDILVRRADIARAALLLMSDGYGLANGEARIDPAIFSLFASGFEARRGDDYVDLHWRIRQRRFPFFPDDDSLWTRSIWIDFEGSRVRTFAPSDLVMFLCAHASKHGWSSLSMICDLAQVIRCDPALDLDAIIAEAERIGSRRMVVLGLYLASQLLQANVPESVLRHARADRDLRALACRVIDQMFADADDKTAASNQLAIALASMERRRDRIRYWAYRAVTPTMGDWEFLPLPRMLYPAYVFIRPLRFVAMYLRSPRAVWRAGALDKI